MMIDRKSVIMNNVVVCGVTPCSLLEFTKVSVERIASNFTAL